VVTRRIVSYDGVLTCSTEDRAASSKRRSQYGLDARTVVKRYAARSESKWPFEALIDDV